MKISDIRYYARFIFSSLDGNMCLSTTDLNVLMQIKSAEDGEVKKGYTIGDIVYFDTDGERGNRIKISDIRIRSLYNDTKTISFGFDESDCENWAGEPNEPLFIVHITIEKV